MSPDSSDDIAPTATQNLLSRLKQVLEATNTIVWEVDLEERKVDYFGPVEEATGLPTEELHDPSDVNAKTTHPADQEKVAEAFTSLISGETQQVDLEYRTNPDHGPVRWIRIQGFLEIDPTGAKTLVGFSTDVTPLKEKEARLDEFARIVAHDLRNPLSVAEGWLKLAQEQESSEELDRALEALDRMEKLINDILTLARDGDVVSEVEHVVLKELVEDAWSNVTTESATLQIDAAGTLVADRSRVQQVFENLFRNAVEHGGNEVSVTVGVTEDGFYIEDDGVGIPKAERDRLLEPAAATSSGRSGLGLRIVSQIVTAHDWNIQITDSSEGGARFEITGIEWA